MRRIESYAELLGHELTTRGELFTDEPEHPRAKEEYFKLQIGQLQTLEHPILADKWRRLTFIYTTGEHLLKAENIRDLAIREEERGLIWKALGDPSSHPNQYASKGEDRLQIDPDLLSFIEGWFGSEFPNE